MGVEASTLYYVFTAATTAASIDQQNRSRRAGAAMAAAEQRRADAENLMKVRQEVRKARIAQASMVNTAASTGGMGGSGLAGGMSSVSSQLGGNLSFMENIARENSVILGAQTTAAKAQSNAAIYGQVGQLSNTIFSPYLRAPKSSGTSYTGAPTNDFYG